MTKLKLAAAENDKPVKLTLALPAALHRDLVAYAEIMSREAGKTVEPAKLIAPMLGKFIASDRAGFRREVQHPRPPWITSKTAAFPFQCPSFFGTSTATRPLNGREDQA